MQRRRAMVLDDEVLRGRGRAPQRRAEIDRIEAVVEQFGVVHGVGPELQAYLRLDRRRDNFKSADRTDRIVHDQSDQPLADIVFPRLVQALDK